MRRVRELAPLVAAPVLAAVLVVTACAPAEDAPAPVPGGTAPASPTAATSSPTPEPMPVAGERVPAAHWVDASGLLQQRADEVGPPDTVLPAVHAVGDWLDAHLDDLQRGGPGRLGDVAPAPLLTAASDADLAAVTTALASVDAPVASAVYRLDATYEEATQWVTATVEVTSTDGSVAAATLVFVPGDAGPELVLFGPAATSDAPA